jgi:superfamily II DNA/RNA helicase
MLLGGVDMQLDIQQYESNGGNIVIATPGRLDYFIMKVHSFVINKLEILVMDEADRYTWRRS